MRHVVIIAGGSGKRLWPKSKAAAPKFLLKLDGKRSLLQDTVARAKAFVPLENILIIANKDHIGPIRKDLPRFPKNNLVAEPVSRNTGPAVCMGASLVNKKDPNALLYIMPADHVIKEKEALIEIFSLAGLIAHIKESIVTVGIKPTLPATGYGYIKIGKHYKSLKSETRYDAFKVDRFTEKPSLAKAKQFIKTKKYLWNSGIFAGQAKVFLEEFKRYKPSLYKVSKKIERGLATKRQQSYIDRHYKTFKDISLDYAIMEKTKKAYVIKADIDWNDIGSWVSMGIYIKADSQNNIIQAKHLGIDTESSVIIGQRDHLLATVGLKDIVIVQTDEATVVCSKERAEDVKKLVELGKKKGLKKYL